MTGKRFAVFALGLLIPFLLAACAAQEPGPQESSVPPSAASAAESSAAPSPAPSAAESSSAPSPESSQAESSSLPPSSAKPASGSESSGGKAVPSPSEQIAALRQDSSVSQFEVSHHSGQIAVARKAGDVMSFSVIDTKSGRETAVPSISGNLYDPKWSFDDKYLIVEEGTAIRHTTHLLIASTLREKAALGVTAAIWASSGDYLAISKVNQLKPTVEMELDGTTDVFLYHADTLSEKLLLKADSDTLYTPEKWDGANLYVRKSSLTSNTSETVCLKVLLATPVQSGP